VSIILLDIVGWRAILRYTYAKHVTGYDHQFWKQRLTCFTFVELLGLVMFPCRSCLQRDVDFLCVSVTLRYHRYCPEQGAVGYLCVWGCTMDQGTSGLVHKDSTLQGNLVLNNSTVKYPAMDPGVVL
jgi:hypothetical protein